jgi:hypothetical protein
MPIVVVEYSVPVLCYVDTDENKIQKIKVDDESIVLTADVYTIGDLDITDIESTDPLYRRAQFIAENMCWPSWHHGF